MPGAWVIVAGRQGDCVTRAALTRSTEAPMPKANSVFTTFTVGKTFARWTIISKPRRKRTRWYALCRCKCGKEKAIYVYTLLARTSQSCGCLGRENSVAALTIHGDSGKQTVEYNTWRRMKQRCTNKNRSNYKYYGARGIRVCAKWENNYQAFLKDMGRRPNAHHSLDRIDTNGNYEPGNCKWSTPKQQRRNRRDYLLKRAA